MLSRYIFAALSVLSVRLSAIVVALSVPCAAMSQDPFWLGADISGTTMMEHQGVRFFNAAGSVRENTALMRELGLNAVRLRVWVNPRDGFCAPADVLTMALRAREHGMAVMVDFHYSDWWADPGKQTIPAAWRDMSYSQMKRAVARHTEETLRLLRSHGVEVRWVQVGNETTHGFLWDMGRAESNMKQYAGLTEAGCRAVKKVFPRAQTIVHLDGGCDLGRYHRILDGLREHGVGYDMIGMSVYPYWDLSAGLTKSEDETLSRVVSNIKTLHREYGKELMIVETGYEARRWNDGYRYMHRLIEAVRNQTDGHCHGVFYWAPEAEGHYALGAFYHRKPTHIMDAFAEQSRGLAVGDTTFYATRELHSRSQNGDIWGRLYLPYSSCYRSAGGLPVVIMAHGFGGTHEEPRLYAEVLASHGIAAYLLDFCGGGMHSRSEGRTTDMNIFTEQADLEAVTRTVKTIAGIDTARVMLLGCSQGGLVSAITAAAHPDSYSGLLLIYPAFDIPFTARGMLERLKDRPDEFEFWGMKLSRKYYEPLVDYNPYDVVGRYRGPVCFVYGDADNIVPTKSVERAAKLYRRPRLSLVKQGDHGFHHPFRHRQAELFVLQFVQDLLAGDGE